MLQLTVRWLLAVGLIYQASQQQVKKQTLLLTRPCLLQDMLSAGQG